MNYIRLTILFFITLALSLLLHYMLNGMGEAQYNFTLINISDTTLLVSIILLVPTVLMLSKSYLVFQAMVYTTKIIINPSYKQKYPTLKDYQNDKTSEITTTIFYELGLIGLIYLIASITLGIIYTI